MTVRLRPHHLLCLLTYAGKGYSPAFIAGFTAIAKRIEAGEQVQIVDGPDDVCQPMLDDPKAHCRNGGVTLRDARAAQDVGSLLSREIRPGVVLSLSAARIARLRKGFAAQRIRAACLRCDWSELCDQISQGGYTETIIPNSRRQAAVNPARRSGQRRA